MTIILLGRDSIGRDVRVDDRTLFKIRAAEARLGFKLVIAQGSYNSSNESSAGTHDRGGVLDISVNSLPKTTTVWRVLTVLRECGLIAWYRTPSQGPWVFHIHLVDYGNPNLSSGAQAQVRAWEQGFNGLANRATDDGPHVRIPKEIAVKNHVTQGRVYIEMGLAELKQARVKGRPRPAVSAAVTAIQAILNRMPKS